MKTKFQLEQENIRLKLLVRKALALLEDDENKSIYSIAYVHGATLSDAYAKKSKPVFDALKKLANE
jgi:hypothetical protein